MSYRGHTEVCVRFYTEPECQQWLSDRRRQKPDVNPLNTSEAIPFPAKPGRFLWLAHWIASTIPYRSPTLLWITEWGIWDNTETSHLYYRLRNSYGDHRLLWEAPGHLFLAYETEDLASFLQLAMLNGWGGYILTDANYVNGFLSHDEYLRFFADERSNLDSVVSELTDDKNPRGGQ